MQNQGAPFTIGPAAASDEADVIALWGTCNLTVPWNDPQADFRLALGRENSDILIACSEDQIVGSLMLGHDGHRGWIYYVSTAPERRRQGIARRLISEAEQWLKERHIPKLQLLVRASNLPVVAFYETLGFQTLDIVTLQKALEQKHG